MPGCEPGIFLGRGSGAGPEGVGAGGRCWRRARQRISGSAHQTGCGPELPVKITFIGLTISSSWGNGHATPYRALLRALERLGCELVFYERDVHYYHQRRDFTRSDYCRLELYPSWSEVRTQALADARSSDAVVLGSFVSEGDRI